MLIEPALKSNVATFIGGLDIINRLRPISFKWKQDGAKDIGLGAEEVERSSRCLPFATRKARSKASNTINSLPSSSTPSKNSRQRSNSNRNNSSVNKSKSSVRNNKRDRSARRSRRSSENSTL